MKEQLLKIIDSNNIEKILIFMQKFDSYLLNNDMNPDLTSLFYQLMCKNYNNEKVGDILFHSYLIYNTKLSPSLIAYFYLREKEKMGFKLNYNTISFQLNGLACTDHKLKSFAFNYYTYENENKNKNTEEYNYRILEIILHELYHVYQFSIDKHTENLFEQVILNDIEIFNYIQEKINYMGLHDSVFMIEREADEYSKRIALDIAKNEHLFNEQFLIKKEKELKERYQKDKHMRNVIDENLLYIMQIRMKDAISLGINYQIAHENYEKVKEYISKNQELIEKILQLPGNELYKLNLGLITLADLEQDITRN